MKCWIINLLFLCFWLQARVVLYKNGSKVRFLKFNAAGTDNINWFSQEKLMSSSWTDLKTFTASEMKYFDIYGHRGVQRSFEVSTLYGSCKNDGGWLVITCSGLETNCAWAKSGSLTNIIYSNKTTSTNFNSGNIIYFLY